MSKFNQGMANKMATMWSYNSIGIDNANKVEFDKFYDVLKHKDTREVNTKVLKDASKSIVSDTQRRGFVSMVVLAIGYTEVNTVCNYSYIEWTNLKRVVSLHKYVLKHHGEDSCTVIKDKLSKVYTKGMSPERYNNALTTELDTLKEEYKVDNTKQVTVEDSLVYIDSVSVDVKRAMLDKLMEEFGYEVQEVA